MKNDSSPGMGLPILIKTYRPRARFAASQFDAQLAYTAKRGPTYLGDHRVLFSVHPFCFEE